MAKRNWFGFLGGISQSSDSMIGYIWKNNLSWVIVFILVVLVLGIFIFGGGLWLWKIIQ